MCLRSAYDTIVFSRNRSRRVARLWIAAYNRLLAAIFVRYLRVVIVVRKIVFGRIDFTQEVLENAAHVLDNKWRKEKELNAKFKNI